KTLGRLFYSMYYIDIASGSFCEFSVSHDVINIVSSKQEIDFFTFLKERAQQYIHPEDLTRILHAFERENLLKVLSENTTYTTDCRLLLQGKLKHVRLVVILCMDRKHMITCLEDIGKEVRKREEERENLESAQRLARRDELTGVKNKKAFCEEKQKFNRRINTESSGCQFSVVMCDVNDLKLANDTRGHNFGDELIQRACRMICEIYKHSPVFRIGGDEFAVVLTGRDYEQRANLLQDLKNETMINKKSRTGPVVACGMADYDSERDTCFSDVFQHADEFMYENKKNLKSEKIINSFQNMSEINTPIPQERKRLLDGMFGSLLTVSGGGYVYLNDMKYDFSRWALSLVDDFGLESEYMYHAGDIWLNYIHPDDMNVYKDAVNAVLSGNAELRLIYYRARKADGSYALLTTRGFVLTDKEGKPEYFGGIMIPH
nr:diguanylate cyclase [Eubacterium sp.]